MLLAIEVGNTNMVLGLFAQMYGVDPRQFHEWHMAMYLDAIDWVSLPNAPPCTWT